MTHATLDRSVQGVLRWELRESVLSERGIFPADCCLEPFRPTFRPPSRRRTGRSVWFTGHVKRSPGGRTVPQSKGAEKSRRKKIPGPQGRGCSDSLGGHLRAIAQAFFGLKMSAGLGAAGAGARSRGRFVHRRGRGRSRRSRSGRSLGHRGHRSSLSGWYLRDGLGRNLRSTTDRIALRRCGGDALGRGRGAPDTRSSGRPWTGPEEQRRPGCSWPGPGEQPGTRSPEPRETAGPDILAGAAGAAVRGHRDDLRRGLRSSGGREILAGAWEQPDTTSPEQHGAGTLLAGAAGAP